MPLHAFVAFFVCFDSVRLCQYIIHRDTSTAPYDGDINIKMLQRHWLIFVFQDYCVHSIWWFRLVVIVTGHSASIHKHLAHKNVAYQCGDRQSTRIERNVNSTQFNAKRIPNGVFWLFATPRYCAIRNCFFFFFVFFNSMRRSCVRPPLSRPSSMPFAVIDRRWWCAIHKPERSMDF